MLQALILGIVQGATEFLPVSSSAHLVLVSYFAGWEGHGLAFDVALHLGSLVAVVWHFRVDLLDVARGMVARGGEEGRGGRRLLALLVIGTLPVAVAGLTFESTVERAFTEATWTAGFLLVTAVLLWLSERVARPPAVSPDEPPPPVHEARVLGWGDAAVMGVAQAFALFPGISRSGATIAAGLLRGIDRRAAARFSFLLSIPAIVGAIVLQVPELGVSQVPMGEVVVGVLASFVASLWAIRFLLRIITTQGLNGFAVYLVALAAVVLAVAL